jgi:lipopolysaccharide/colanic/teichoic acid biosynthesis glycosyltransferase
MLRVHHANRPWTRPSGQAEAAAGQSQAEAPGPVLTADQGIGPIAARRLLDIAVATVILLLAWPLFLALVVATRRSTGGSAIYRQLRVGQGGVPFTLYKFRTMLASMTGPEVTAPGDHRITRLGALLRRTSIDELPQIVNVLLGHMTLVGPRPESVALARRYPADCQFVFRFRPGITGPSQVLVRDEKVLTEVADVETYYLGELVPHRVAMDLEYLRDPTLALTIRWLVVTAFYLMSMAKPRLAHKGALGPGRACRLGRSADELAAPAGGDLIQMLR